MKNIYILINICSILSLLIYCHGKGSIQSNEKVEIDFVKKTSNRYNDSIELTNLIRQVYKWHMEKKLDDFPYKFDQNNDSIFIGIDWVKYQSNVEILKMTNFFSNDFLINHKNIALTLDSSISKADIFWRNINHGIPLWETNADNWCGCQDYPDNYWETLTIDSLLIEEDYAIFNWTWTNEWNHSYKITSKKEEGKWKISSMEGFKYFFSVDYYDNSMKEKH